MFYLKFTGIYRLGVRMEIILLVDISLSIYLNVELKNKMETNKKEKIFYWKGTSQKPNKNTHREIYTAVHNIQREQVDLQFQPKVP